MKVYEYDCENCDKKERCIERNIREGQLRCYDNQDKYCSFKETEIDRQED